MPDAGGELAWWSPDPRGVIPLDGLLVSRSLRRSCRRYEIRVDTAFEEVIDACADPSRAGGWITDEILDAYVELHRAGFAHSVEAWAVDDDGGDDSAPDDGTGGGDPPSGGRVLAGGLYGVAVGGLFAGESMFSRRTDASKAALVGLVDRLRRGGGVLLDVQWLTPHLARLGAVEVPRMRYLELLAGAVTRPQLTLTSCSASTPPG